MYVVKRSGDREELDTTKIDKCLTWAAKGLIVSKDALLEKIQNALHDGIHTSDLHGLSIREAASMIKWYQPDYTYFAARLLLQQSYKEVNTEIGTSRRHNVYYPHLRAYLAEAVVEEQVSPALIAEDSGFDLEKLNKAIDPERDFLYQYLGLRTVVDRYLRRRQLHDGKAPLIELPQHMWMRIAMGLALREDHVHRTDWAIEFYNVMSNFEYVPSTPTLFNSGTLHPQMSSCYVGKVEDNLVEEGGIYDAIKECAALSKFSGGLGNDWNDVRAAGSSIKSTNGKSSGLIPFLKVYNDTSVAVNQGGKRKGAMAPYIEPWHADALDFNDLKKNSGDERRRTFDIFPAWWIPDLFMERVEQRGKWTFFSPNEVPGLHDAFGDEFKFLYEQYEQDPSLVRGQVDAYDFWKKMINSLYETGAPWITFKDECNRRNPQDHVGVIHNSNLCTEITLNNSIEEVAVCNLGSVNLARVKKEADIKRVVKLAMRMLDNVVDLNYYPSERARRSNLRHRPVGLGVMGYTEQLVQRGILWESEAHLDFADLLFERISYYAIEASCDLAVERGAYESFPGSKWSRGILPIDTARNNHQTLDWASLRQKVVKHGMRNSNTMAIAPTATISNIVGTTACIEPSYLRQYTEGNLSGDFIVVDPCLRYVEDGDYSLCKVAFEIDPRWGIRAAARRQKWIDQAQSHNLFAPLGYELEAEKISDLYFLAWKLGMKTTYYLRAQTHEMPNGIEDDIITDEKPKVCSILNPNCEACQ